MEIDALDDCELRYTTTCFKPLALWNGRAVHQLVHLSSKLHEMIPQLCATAFPFFKKPITPEKDAWQVALRFANFYLRNKRIPVGEQKVAAGFEYVISGRVSLRELLDERYWDQQVLTRGVKG